MSGGPNLIVNPHDFDADGTHDSRYYTEAEVDALLAVFGILSAEDSSTVDLSVTDGVLSADVIAGGIEHEDLAGVGVRSHADLDALYSAYVNHNASTAEHGVTGAVAGTQGAQTFQDKTLITPTIASFTNAQHNHSNAAGGGTIAHSSLSGIGTSTHAVIDSHIANAAIHFPYGSILPFAGISSVGESSTPNFAVSSEVDKIAATNILLTSGTWSGIILYAATMWRNSATGLMNLYPMFDGVQHETVQFTTNVNTKKPFLKGYVVTGVASGTHTVGIKYRGSSTAETTNIDCASIQALFWRTS